MLLRQFPFPKIRRYARLVVYLTAACLLATAAASAQQPDEAEEENFGPIYVRRFSAGAKFVYLPLKALTNQPVSTNVTDNVLFNAISNPESDRFGYGLTTQVAINNHWAVSVEAFTHKVKYSEFRDINTFIIDPFDMVLLESQLETQEEVTTARLWDIPVLLRYYTKGRRERGPRVFFEGGFIIRNVTNVKSSVGTTFTTTNPDVEDTMDCCDTTPITPANSPSLGGTAGMGFQLIDDVGIRVVPGVRYTRWFNNAFDSPPTRSEQHQAEISIALTF